MKNFFLGILICSLCYGNIAKALDVSLQNLTTKDLFACAALTGLLAHGNTSESANTIEYYTNLSWKYSDAMTQKRSK